MGKTKKESVKDVYIQDVHEQYSVIASEVITIFHHFLTFLHIFITAASKVVRAYSIIPCCFELLDVLLFFSVQSSDLDIITATIISTVV